MAKAYNVTLREGVYAGLTGPTYETPAEIRMLRTLGARNRQVRQALLAEFLVLGGVAGVLAGVGAVRGAGGESERLPRAFPPARESGAAKAPEQ